MTIRKIKHNDKQIYTEMAKDFYSSPAVLEDIPEDAVLGHGAVAGRAAGDGIAILRVRIRFFEAFDFVLDDLSLVIADHALTSLIPRFQFPCPE